MIAITARVPGPRTAQELSEASYQFFTDPEFHRPMGFKNHSLFFAEAGEVKYENGILFGSLVNKGAVFKALLSSPQAHPSQKIPRFVLFVDDAVSESQNVLQAMTDSGIQTISFRYMAPGREHFEY